MIRKGSCWDKAVAASFFKSLKTELIYGKKTDFKRTDETGNIWIDWIWYNRKRRHSAFNYAIIKEFKNQINYKM